MKTIIITGGCGFIGSNLACHLASRGHQVVALDNISRRGSECIITRIEEAGCRFVHGDIRVREDFAALPAKADCLIDCSAEPSVLAGTTSAGAAKLLGINLSGSLNCFQWCLEHDVPVVFLSTSRVYPHDRINRLERMESETRFQPAVSAPGITDRGLSEDFPLEGVRTLYGASKLASELVLREYCDSFGLPAVINRCGVVAGPWQLGRTDQGFLMYWVLQHYLQKPLSYIGFGGTGKQVRDVLHIADLAALVDKQLVELEELRGDTFNVGGSRTAHCSLQELTDICSRVIDTRLEPGRVETTRPGDIYWYVTDTARVEARFGWKPRRNVEATVEDAYRWALDHADIIESIR